MIDPITNQTLSAIQQGLFLLENHGITLIFTSSFLYLIIKAINAAINVSVSIIEKKYGIIHDSKKKGYKLKQMHKILFLSNYLKGNLMFGV